MSSTGPLVLPLVIGVDIALLLLLLLLICTVIAFLLRLLSRWHSLKINTPAQTPVEMFDWHLRLSWKSLQQATSNFSHDNILGVGGSSTVYKGKLLDGKMIAIKVFQDNPAMLCDVQKQFFTELDVLGKLRHRNLVRILGYCHNLQDTMAIILAFMPMGSLDALLHNHSTLPNTILGSRKGNSSRFAQQSNIDLKVRFHILLGIAEGLAYLHHEYDGKLCIIHGDLKPSNVLLDEQMEAHIADFGLARMVGATNTASIARLSRQRVLPDTQYWWTVGYTASECAQQGRAVSPKADVFSFGVIILEVMTGERPSSSKLEEGQTLADWVGKALAGGEIEGVAASALKEAGDWDASNIVQAILMLGCRCASYQPTARPDMHQVLAFLHHLVDSASHLSTNAGHRHIRVNNEDSVWMLSSMS